MIMLTWINENIRIIQDLKLGYLLKDKCGFYWWKDEKESLETIWSCSKWVHQWERVSWFELRKQQQKKVEENQI